MAEATPARREELDRLALQIGDQALGLFRQFTREEISATELGIRLQELEAGAVMARYWDVLTREPASAPCFVVLQLVNSLAQDMPYQVQRYGESSLWDDLKELQLATRRIRARVANPPS